MKKWQIILAVVVVILAIAVFFLWRSSNIYSAQVVTVAAGENIGIAPFTDRIDFGDVPQGDNITKTVTLTNDGSNSNSIKIYILGSISQMITVSPGKSFSIGAGKTQDIVFQLAMPATSPVGKKFTGRIIILNMP